MNKIGFLRSCFGRGANAAGFGHGEPVAGNASMRFDNKWGQKLPA
jgi:hypothetical protein